MAASPHYTERGPNRLMRLLSRNRLALNLRMAMSSPHLDAQYRSAVCVDYECWRVARPRAAKQIAFAPGLNHLREYRCMAV